jgi:hypothetical protein
MMTTMTLGHRIALWVVTSLVALMMVVVGPGVSAASADSPNNGSAKHSSSGDSHCDKKHDNNHKNYKKNKKNKKDKGAGAATPLPSPAVEAAQASLPEVAVALAMAAGHKASACEPY